jgi:leader peptidase (prepilin peptidase) / N-methyltransferase
MMHAFYVPLAFLFGLVFGSFLNVCITRLPLGESIVQPRSHCRDCDHQLAWWENLPVVSWIMLRGHCSGCKAPIAWRYPLVELALASLWASSVARFGMTFAALDAAVFCFLLLGLFFTDAETMLLPDWLTVPGILLGLALRTIAAMPPDREDAFLTGLAGAALGALTLLAIYGIYYLLRRRAGLGWGDIKLVAMLGAFLGPMEVALTFVLGTLLAAAAALILLSRRKPEGKENSEEVAWLTRALPFGSFLCVAGIYALFWGPENINWYLKLYR